MGMNAIAAYIPDTLASIAFCLAAGEAGVKQFVLVSSLGTGKFGLPAGVLK